MQEYKNVLDIETVFFSDETNELVILDQTLLPNETKYLRLTEQNAIHEAIRSLRVRGAPAIGITAAYAYYLAAAAWTGVDGFAEHMKKAGAYMATARPTAVNLFWALNRMAKCRYDNRDKEISEIKTLLLAEAHSIRNEDIEMCRAIGEHGLSLLKPGMGLLTHCNAGQLAAARYGTALAPIYLGHQRGYGFKVYADETRPLLQGARLTAYELSRAGVDVTLICDNMASAVMRSGKIHAVFVGCDRVAANGDVANKIGTSGVAILAKYYGIPFYVCAPSSTIDYSCPDGSGIVIEERDPREISEMWYRQPMTAEGVRIYNPAFDITKSDDITAIITEKGISRPPYNFIKNERE